MSSIDGDGNRPTPAARCYQAMFWGADGAPSGGDRDLPPVSSNGMIDAMPEFSRILRSRIGSPFVSRRWPKTGPFLGATRD